MQKNQEFDAIVVGSGITGGWAAKELCEKGMKTLVLERGNRLPHPNYPEANTAPWEFPHRGTRTESDRKEYPIQSTVYAFNEGTRDYWVKDTEHPYTSTADGPSYKWIRGYHEGGRSIMWGRQCYRWSDLDFNANAKDGYGVDWPIRYKDIAPWYSYVEKYVGISGQKEGLAQLPDGEFLPPYDMNCVEEHVKKGIEQVYPDRRMTIGRVANLTVPHNGRGQCQRRNLCYRGCPYGAYFSSQAVTLPAAENTGNMTFVANSVVTKLLYDKDTRRITGVHVLNSQDGTDIEYKAKVVFLCASTLNSTWLLLHSANEVFPKGLANSSGALGKYLMDHQYQAGAFATFEGFDDQYYFGGRPNGIYLPRFRNVSDQHPDFIRGYGYQGGASREGSLRGSETSGIGKDFKDELMKPGPWNMRLHGFGEVLPYADNYITLNEDVKDVHGLPTLSIHVKHRENEAIMRKDFINQAMEMLEAVGGKDVQSFNGVDHPGFGIHEMGTARMGKDPKSSVLNRWNQSHDIPNLFITDGSCMASAACVNPSITYMALTARAVDYATKELNKQNI
ncbi:MAG: GMC family oxidoreductase [Saprospiraceae bacterium]|nr:GMC family oxidoreductase [Saprospiraceae bacterium]